MAKWSEPCRVCKGKFKIACMLCGWKKQKPSKEPKKITRSERRSDFLGDLYNQLKLYTMEYTGVVGDIDGEIVVISADCGENFEIVDLVGRWLVSKSLISNLRVNQVDVEILKKIGDPLLGPAYKRIYKKKKNEV